MPTPSLTPQEFVDKWRHATLTEKAAAQEHFLDLCHLIGHATPAEADPTGKSFAFEVSAEKLALLSKTGEERAGGHGFADVWKKGFFAWEYKGKHANLDKAYQQLLQYCEDLQNPPLLIVSDIDRIVVHTKFSNSVKQIRTLTLDDLLTADGLKQLTAIFTNPDFFKAPQTTEEVTKEAAADFARLADRLRKYGTEPQRAAHFLIRLLFCLFAEDTKLLPNELFSRLIDQTRRKSNVFAAQLKQLFGVMATGGWFGTDQIPHFNGGLFNDDSILELDSDSLDILARVSKLDWSSIEPSIFGTLFVRSLDPAQRAQLGAQYTSKEDIVLIVEPVLMAPLRRKWIDVQHRAHELAAQRRAATGAKRTKLDKQLRDLLIGFATELALIQVLDPACGSGNFLYVALKLLLDLWKEVSNFMAELGFSRLMPQAGFAPSPQQLHGLEINAYAHELAQVTIWIGYIQWLRDNGFGTPPEPILQPIETVKQMDAILAYDKKGKPVEPVWPKADVILGNPPFLGSKNMRGELGDAYVENLGKLYADRVSSGSDLVVFWFEKARAILETGKAKRVGLLATKVIRQQRNRWVLDKIKRTGDIFMAWSDIPWVLDGASVRIAMVGFDDGSEQNKTLDGVRVNNISSDLSRALNVAAAKPLPENLNLSFMGITKVGDFDLTAQQAAVMLDAPLNPNGRPNSDVVKPLINGDDITGRPRETWIIDFGVDTPLEEAAKYEKPFEHVKRYVKPQRDKVRSEKSRQHWWIFERPRPAMRLALQGLQRYIVTVLVAKHRLFTWIPATVSPSARVIVIARDDDYFLGVLHSHVHELWALRMGGRHGIGNDLTYNNSVCFETFAFPWPPDKEPKNDPRVKAIAAAARELVQLRDNWLNPPDATEAELKKRTLTNLYNKHPPWLDNAHRKLDAAVFEAYGWPHDISDEEILSKLLALNLERAGK
jgi:type II restriction/modification system DNA methylase subunit YeeA